MSRVKLAPSILDSDFTKIRQTLKFLEREKADYIHLDIMDGNFVPNLTFGMKVIKPMRPLTKLPFDTHLMINNPEAYVERFADAGSDLITFHLEASKNPAALIKKIHSLGKKAGISIKPATPAKKVFKYLRSLELLLVMSVEPGFGGQKFMTSSLDKVCALKKEIKRTGSRCVVSIDGGINLETAALACGAGVDVMVAGNAIFGAKSPAKAIRALKAIANKHI